MKSGFKSIRRRARGHGLMQRFLQQCRPAGAATAARPAAVLRAESAASEPGPMLGRVGPEGLWPGGRSNLKPRVRVRLATRANPPTALAGPRANGRRARAMPAPRVRVSRCRPGRRRRSVAHHVRPPTTGGMPARASKGGHSRRIPGRASAQPSSAGRGCRHPRANSDALGCIVTCIALRHDATRPTAALRLPPSPPQPPLPVTRHRHTGNGRAASARDGNGKAGELGADGFESGDCLPCPLHLDLEEARRRRPVRPTPVHWHRYY
jgi:hypothetical protein